MKLPRSHGRLELGSKLVTRSTLRDKLGEYLRSPPLTKQTEARVVVTASENADL